MLVMRHTKYKKFYAQKEMNDDQPRVYRNTSRCLNKAIGITNCHYSRLRYTHRVFYLFNSKSRTASFTTTRSYSVKSCSVQAIC